MEYLVQDTSLTAIADAIRAKDGSTDKLTLAQMPEKITSIQNGGGDLSSIDVYIADFTVPADLTVTAGAVDKYARIVVA